MISCPLWMLDQVFDAIGKTMAELGERIKTLEARPRLQYRGVWDAEAKYEPGDAVTCSGSLWVAKHATCRRPDEYTDASRDWQLAVKKGRDGR